MHGYNYTQLPFYADCIEDELIITKVIMNEETRKTEKTYYFYPIGDMNVTELDNFTRTKIQEING
jgi:hypothetical protein